MFDIGLDKIASLLASKSQNALNDLTTKLKPVQSPTARTFKPMPSTRAPSRIEPPIDPKQLQEKKNKLMKELQTVDNQIRKTKIEQSRIEARKKTEESFNDPEAFHRAASLVARMNQKRKEQSLAEQKKSEKRELQLQESLKQFKEMNEKQQKQKQQKRLQIEQRIQKRKMQIKAVQEFSKKSNHLIQELQSYRVSLPNITKFKNPEEFQNSFQKLSPQKSRKLSPKTLPRSPFLQRIQQQEMNKKREEYIKSYEKKKIRQRQQVYGRKIRKNLKESSLFVTD